MLHSKLGNDLFRSLASPRSTYSCSHTKYPSIRCRAMSCMNDLEVVDRSLAQPRCHRVEGSAAFCLGPKGGPRNRRHGDIRKLKFSLGLGLSLRIKGKNSQGPVLRCIGSSRRDLNAGMCQTASIACGLTCSTRVTIVPALAGAHPNSVTRSNSNRRAPILQALADNLRTRE